jgi:hypothetical protein
MLGAIGTSSAPASAAGKSTAALAAQLSRCQTQLSDWVNCPSGKSPEGKAKIAEISGNIAELKQRLQQPDVPTAAPTTAPAIQQASHSPTTSLGTRLDVFA